MVWMCCSCHAGMQSHGGCLSVQNAGLALSTLACHSSVLRLLQFVWASGARLALQVGRHNEARESYGHTLAVDPWGTIVGEVGEPATGIAVVRIDLQELRRVRANMPVREHRRQGRISLGWEAA